MKRILAAVIAVAALASMTTPKAQACGVIGCLVNQVAPGAGDALDDENAKLGKPFDHTAAALLNAVVPGSGEVLEGYWTAQDILNAVQNGQISQEDADQLLQQLPD